MIVAVQNPLEDLRALRNLNMVIAGDRIIEYPLDYFFSYEAKSAACSVMGFSSIIKMLLL